MRQANLKQTLEIIRMIQDSLSYDDKYRIRFLHYFTKLLANSYDHIVRLGADETRNFIRITEPCGHTETVAIKGPVIYSGYSGKCKPSVNNLRIKEISEVKKYFKSNERLRSALKRTMPDLFNDLLYNVHMTNKKFKW